MSNSTNDTSAVDSLNTESIARMTGKHKMLIMVGVMAVLAGIVAAIVKSR